MKKIPTLFVRNPDDRRHVLPEVTPGCEWVLAGEGVPTRKYDGTCIGVGIRDGWPGEIWARREVKPGKTPPPGFLMAEHDETTGKVVGWEPFQQSAFAKFIEEALTLGYPEPGTYELVGPKINGNPEGFDRHVLVCHQSAERLGSPRTFAEVRRYLLDNRYEGVVWHHPDGRMAKLKRRDFAAHPTPTPDETGE